MAKISSRKSPSKNGLAKRQKKRKEILESFGYSVYEIWEDDLKTNKWKKIINFIFENCVKDNN